MISGWIDELYDGALGGSLASVGWTTSLRTGSSSAAPTLDGASHLAASLAATADGTSAASSWARGPVALTAPGASILGTVRIDAIPLSPPVAAKIDLLVLTPGLPVAPGPADPANSIIMRLSNGVASIIRTDSAGAASTLTTGTFVPVTGTEYVWELALSPVGAAGAVAMWLGGVLVGSSVTHGMDTSWSASVALAQRLTSERAATLTVSFGRFALIDNPPDQPPAPALTAVRDAIRVAHSSAPDASSRATGIRVYRTPQGQTAPTLVGTIAYAGSGIPSPLDDTHQPIVAGTAYDMVIANEATALPTPGAVAGGYLAQEPVTAFPKFGVMFYTPPSARLANADLWLPQWALTTNSAAASARAINANLVILAVASDYARLVAGAATAKLHWTYGGYNKILDPITDTSVIGKEIRAFAECDLIHNPETPCVSGSRFYFSGTGTVEVLDYSKNDSAIWSAEIRAYNWIKCIGSSPHFAGIWADNLFSAAYDQYAMPAWLDGSPANLVAWDTNLVLAAQRIKALLPQHMILGGNGMLYRWARTPADYRGTIAGGSRTWGEAAYQEHSQDKISGVADIDKLIWNVQAFLDQKNIDNIQRYLMMDFHGTSTTTLSAATIRLLLGIACCSGAYAFYYSGGSGAHNTAVLPGDSGAPSEFGLSSAHANRSWLGAPAAPAVRVAAGVWYRRFASGEVRVNGTTGTLTIDGVVVSGRNADFR